MVGNREAATIGILKYFKPPTASTGKDHYSVVCLVDETQSSSGMSCVVFNPRKHKLPMPCCVGEVVIIKGLLINKFQGNLQGRGHENSLVGIFPGNPSASLPERIGNWYSMRPHELVRVQELREWADVDHPLLLNSKLAELTPANFCSTVCLVVRVSVDGRGTLVLSVCDGTKPKFPLVDPGPLTSLTSSPTLDQSFLALTSTVTVSLVFRPHVISGDVVQLLNVCLVSRSPKTRPPGSSSEGGEPMELVVRDHPQYPGAVNILPSDSEVVRKFTSTLPRPGPAPEKTPPPPGSEQLSGQLSTLIDCPDSQHATLADVQSAPIGSVRVVAVQVVGVGKEACRKLEDICQLRCSGCKSRYLTPHPQDPDFTRLLTEGDVCVCCSADDLLEPNRLEYMYAFTLVVADQCTQMEVAVSGAEGKHFFSHLALHPTNLYVDSEARRAHWSTLHRLTGGTDMFDSKAATSAPQHPSINLCIAVFRSSTSRRMYKIANTRLCSL